MSSAREQVSEFWTETEQARQAPGRAGWRYALDHPRVRQGVYDRYLGGRDPFGWMAQRMALPARHALEIGCGGGHLAFGLIADGYCQHIDAFDVAEPGIIAAQRRVREEGLRTLRFHLLDGNTWTMPRRQYDFIYASHALHHIEGLEHLFTQVATALQPGGVLFAEDYVGPTRMQYSDPHLAAMNRALAVLPDSKRMDCYGRLKTTIERQPPELFLQHDPSEAVRSADILPALRARFAMEVAPMGMSLSFQVLLDIVHNFDPDDPADNALIDQIVTIETEAERTGEAEMLFACIVARPAA